MSTERVSAGPGRRGPRRLPARPGAVRGSSCESIRDQTRRDFRCLIGADGGQEEVRALVARDRGRRPPLRGDRLGRQRRLLPQLRAAARWPCPRTSRGSPSATRTTAGTPTSWSVWCLLLDDALLATGQARVVDVAGRRRSCSSRPHRRVVPAGDLLFENQVTGALVGLPPRAARPGAALSAAPHRHAAARPLARLCAAVDRRLRRARRARSGLRAARRQRDWRGQGHTPALDGSTRVAPSAHPR